MRVYLSVQITSQSMIQLTDDLSGECGGTAEYAPMWEVSDSLDRLIDICNKTSMSNSNVHKNCEMIDSPASHRHLPELACTHPLTPTPARITPQPLAATCHLSSSLARTRSRSLALARLGDTTPVTPHSSSCCCCRPTRKHLQPASRAARARAGRCRRWRGGAGAGDVVSAEHVATNIGTDTSIHAQERA